MVFILQRYIIFGFTLISKVKMLRSVEESNPELYFLDREVYDIRGILTTKVVMDSFFCAASIKITPSACSFHALIIC